MDALTTFRGKIIDTNQAVFGYYLRCSESGNDYIVEYLDETPDGNSLTSMLNVNCYQVHTESLAICTGLPDKNGKIIFSSFEIDGKMTKGGDILECQDRIVVPKYDKNFGLFDSIYIKYIGKICSNGIEAVNWRYRATIIGNHYDNPELLGSK